MHQRLGGAAFDQDKRGQARGCHTQSDQRPGRGPTVRLGTSQGVHQRGQAGHDRGSTEEVEAGEPDPAGRLAGQEADCGDEGRDADGDVDPEDGLPAGPGGQGAADGDAGGDAEASDGAPQGEAAGALGAAVGRHDGGQRSRGHQCGARALERAAGDELAGGGGEAGEQRGAGEQDQAGHEDTATRQQVGDAATEQQASTGKQQVGGHHPLQVAAGQTQVVADDGHGGVDHGDVEHDEDLRDQRKDHHRPGAALLWIGGCVGVGDVRGVRHRSLPGSGLGWDGATAPGRRRAGRPVRASWVTRRTVRT